MVKKGEKAISLTGIKKINSCEDEIEYFEPTESKQLVYMPPLYYTFSCIISI